MTILPPITTLTHVTNVPRTKPKRIPEDTVTTWPGTGANMIWKILILSVVIFIVAKMLPGIYIKSFWTAIIVAIVYSLINFFLFWVLTILALPLVIVTFGLFLIIINAFILWLTDKLIKGFAIRNFGTTILASILISLFNFILQSVF